MLVWEADDGSIEGKLFQNLYQACRALARALAARNSGTGSKSKTFAKS